MRIFNDKISAMTVLTNIVAFVLCLACMRLWSQNQALREKLSLTQTVLAKSRELTSSLRQTLDLTQEQVRDLKVAQSKYTKYEVRENYAACLSEQAKTVKAKTTPTQQKPKTTDDPTDYR